MHAHRSAAQCSTHLRLRTLLTLGAQAQEGYCSCLVCVCVCLSVCLLDCYHSSGDIVRFYTQKQVRGGFVIGFSWLLTRGFSKKTSIRKLWREKANMQMSSYKSVQPVHRGRFSSLLGRVILMFPIVIAALCLPCTAAVASSAASDSRRINTVYSLPTVYNTYLVQEPLPYPTDSW